MAETTEMTITKKLTELQSVFDKVKRVFYDAMVNINLNTVTKLGYELPVIEDSFSFDSGAVSISSVKITTGQKWASYVTAGDPSITMQVASVDKEIAKLFMTEKGTAVSSGTNTLGGLSLSGQGYSTETKKVTGSLILASEDGTRLIALPNVEMFANPVIASGTPAYFNVQIFPKPNNDGADIILLNGTKSG